MKKFFLICLSILFIQTSLFAQTTTITGKVLDATTGNSIAGANISAINGATGATSTSASGDYSLVATNPSNGDFHVAVSANGYCYREKWTWSRKIIDFHMTACNYDRNRDSLALRALYDSTDGANWRFPWNWNNGILNFGLTYHTNGGGPIKFLNLDSLSMNGFIPSALNNLTDNYGFDFLVSPNLRSFLPSLSNMKQLDWVKIWNTGMSGDPLSSLAGLKNLEMISIRNNPSIAAIFPSDYTYWNNIYKLQLENIGLSGAIPSAIFNLTNVQTLGLGQNKLTGTVPNIPAANIALKYLVLNDNDLDSLPDLSNSNLTALGVKGNRLTFDDIIPNLSKFNTATSYEGATDVFSFSPQDSFYVDTTITKMVGDPLSIDLKIDGALTTNTYIWRKDGVEQIAYTSNSNKLIINSLQSNDAGVWICKVANNNPAFIDLKLWSRRITIVVQTCRQRDSLALVDLYNSTNGASWTNRWDLAQPMNTWHGVTLTIDGCLKQLELAKNNLDGPLPTTLDTMQSMTIFNLFDNKLTGGVPNLTMPDLQWIILDSNRLTGTIPNINRPNLTVLGLGNNQLTGTIPNFNLPNLQEFTLSNNQLTGTIPNFSSMTNLRNMRLANNQLTGTIPNFSFTNLLSLEVSENELTGAIPNFNLPSLEVLTVSNNQLSGSLPNFNLPNLKILYADFNQLTGTIPVFSMPIHSVGLGNNKFDSLSQQQLIANPTQLFQVGNNKLTFDDVINSLIQSNTVLNGYLYTPQDSIFLDTTVTKNTGDPLSISLRIDGALTTNIYRWYKDGVRQVTIDSTTNTLKINSLQSTDAGVWTCQIVNPNAPLLTLNSQKITLQVNSSNCNTRDLAVLKNIYTSTNGAAWTANLRWDTTQPLSNLTLATAWKGITLTSQGCAETIDLTDANLNGILPMSLGNLVNLKSLLISGSTNLRSPIPNSIGQLDSVISLDLSGNGFTGSIPDSIGGMVQLGSLNLQDNRFSGSLPTTFRNLTQPQFQLLLSDNNVANTIAAFFPQNSMPPNLNRLSARKMGLTGDIPTYFANFNWEYLYLDENQLTGALPEGFKTLPFGTSPQATFSLSENRMDSLPIFTVHNRNAEVWIEKNKFTFDDIKPIASIAATVQCANQDSIGVDNFVVSGNIGAPLSIDYLKVDYRVADNIYKWTRITAPTQTKTIVGDNKLIFNTLTDQDTGVWRCVISNPTVPLCTLYSRNLIVRRGARLITSRVLDACTNQPLANITIQRNQGASVISTDAAGYFSVLTNSIEDSLIINLVGYKPTTKSVKDTPILVGRYLSKTVAAFVCNGSNYTRRNGTSANSTGIYRDTVAKASGCDSIYIVNLTVGTPPTVRTAQNQSICTGQTFTLPLSRKVISTAGTYGDTLKNFNLTCDSILSSIILRVATPQYLSQNHVICSGDSFQLPIRRTWVKTAGAYRDTLKTAAPLTCDSVITTYNLTLKDAAFGQLSRTICRTETLRVGDSTFSVSKPSGSVRLPKASFIGCDSVVQVSLSFYQTLNALDDDFELKIPNNSLEINVLTNDVTGNNPLSIRAVSSPYGQLDTLGLGKFRFTRTAASVGANTSFRYVLCNAQCNVCDTATVTIKLPPPPRNGHIAVGITPDGDGVNDVLTFPDLDKFPTNELVISNRWGDVVFKAKPYRNDWDGKNQSGTDLPTGTYYFIMRLDINDGKFVTGDVTIFR